ncbi:hypothetical protein RYX36_009566 [Vicia faba]
MSSTSKPNLLWMVHSSVSFLSTIFDITSRSNGTINRHLLSLLDWKIPPNPNSKSINDISSSDIVVNSTHNLWFRLFIPSSAYASTISSLPVIIFFHGGSFAYMSPSSIPYHFLCRLFCRYFPAIVVSVNYRLTLEHRFPYQYEDGLEILKFLDKNSDVLGKSADITKYFLAGDSAGGNLAHHVAVWVSSEKFQILKVIELISATIFRRRGTNRI